MKCGYFFLPEAGFIFPLKGHCDKTKTHLRRGIIYLWSGSPFHCGTLFIFLIFQPHYFQSHLLPRILLPLKSSAESWVLVEVWLCYTYCLFFNLEITSRDLDDSPNHFNLLVMSWKVWENSYTNGKRTRTSLYDRKLISRVWFISYLRSDHT